VSTKDEELKQAADEAEAVQQEVPPETMTALFSGPAVYSNRMYVTNLPLGIRLTFAEGAGDLPDQFRAAVYLTLMDALSLRDLLTRQLTLIGLGEIASEAPKEPEAE
jgi:hypothetical protein